MESSCYRKHFAPVPMMGDRDGRGVGPKVGDNEGLYVGLSVGSKVDPSSPINNSLVHVKSVNAPNTSFRFKKSVRYISLYNLVMNGVAKISSSVMDDDDGSSSDSLYDISMESCTPR